MNFLSTIKLILELLPIIIQTVKQLESVFPASGMGALKFELIKRSLKSSYDVSNDIIPIVETTINSVVSVMNEFGIFSGSSSEK